MSLSKRLERIATLCEGVDPESQVHGLTEDQKFAADDLVLKTFALVLESAPPEAGPSHIGSALALAFDEIAESAGVEVSVVADVFGEWIAEVTSSSSMLTESLSELNEERSVTLSKNEARVLSKAIDDVLESSYSDPSRRNFLRKLKKKLT